MSERVDDEGNMETGGQDRIGALPDELLHYVMSFLLSRDTVRTCVLASCWRTLWKSVPALRILDPQSSSSFVDKLLRLRDLTPLNVCHITSDCKEMVGDDPDWDDQAEQHMKPLIHYAVWCQVQELTVHFPLRTPDMTLISLHLKRLDFDRMRFEGCSLVLSSCQVLQELEMSLCDIFADILSQLLKYLHISDSTFDGDTRRYIFAPNLVGLQLDVSGGLAPLIDNMPSLAEASITLNEGCRGGAGDINYSIALEGLFGAKDLQLLIYDLC